MDKRHEYKWLLICILFAMGVTCCVLTKFVTMPGSIDLELGGDASKNYFTFLYHSLYGKGIWFTGMNYPYGEHIVYVDGQPALSIPLSYLRETLHLSLNNILATLHIAVAIGFFLAIIFTYKTLRTFNVQYIPAIIFASLITILSPQVLRIFGHYGLSYYCIIPMLFFWTAKYYTTSAWRYSVYIMTMGFIASFIHPYFGAVILIWGAFYSTGYLLFTRNTVLKKLRHVFPLLIAVGIVFGSVKVIMHATDPVMDRPVTPIGVLSNGTTGEDIFQSHLSPLSRALNTYVYTELHEPDEGLTYIGWVAIAVVIATIGMAIVAKIRKKPELHILSRNIVPPIWIFIAFASLLLGMGAPFVWGMDGLLDYFPAFKQFRSMGRFSWMFYYTITVLAVVVLMHWVQKEKLRNKIKAYGVLGLSFVIWGIDAFGYAEYIHGRSMNGHENYKAFFKETDWNKFLKKHQHSPADFQAILFLPYFHLGTEKFTFNDNMDWPMTLCMRASLQMKLPLSDAMMSRSSWEQAASQIKVSEGPFTEKPTLHASTKPFLLLLYKDAAINDGVEYIIQNSDFIDSVSLFKVYAFYPGRMLAADKKLADSVTQYYNSMQGIDTCINCDQPYFISHFDDGEFEQEPISGKAMSAITSNEAYVSEYDFTQPTDTPYIYEFSAWVKVGAESPVMPYFILDIFDSKDSILTREQFNIKPSDSKGYWYRAAKTFQMPAGTKKLKCMIVNKPAPSYIALDEIVLKPANGLVVSKSRNGMKMVNNHIYKLKQ
jgi:hypothetical protein